jgi:hypothetical protein
MSTTENAESTKEDIPMLFPFFVVNNAFVFPVPRNVR